jgi:hypothetical protein
VPGDVRTILQTDLSSGARVLGSLPRAGIFAADVRHLHGSLAWLLPELARSAHSPTLQWRALQGLRPAGRAARSLPPEALHEAWLDGLDSPYARIRAAAVGALDRVGSGILDIPGALDALRGALEPRQGAPFPEGPERADDRPMNVVSAAATALTKVLYDLSAQDRRAVAETLTAVHARHPGADALERHATTFWMPPDEVWARFASLVHDHGALLPRDASRQLADAYEASPEATLTDAARAVRGRWGRVAATGAAKWVGRLGPAGCDLLPDLEAAADTDDDTATRRSARRAFATMHRAREHPSVEVADLRYRATSDLRRALDAHDVVWTSVLGRVVFEDVVVFWHLARCDDAFLATRELVRREAWDPALFDAMVACASVPAATCHDLVAPCRFDDRAWLAVAHTVGAVDAEQHIHRAIRDTTVDALRNSLLRVARRINGRYL